MTNYNTFTTNIICIIDCIYPLLFLPAVSSWQYWRAMVNPIKTYFSPLSLANWDNKLQIWSRLRLKYHMYKNQLLNCIIPEVGHFHLHFSPTFLYIFSKNTSWICSAKATLSKERKITHIETNLTQWQRVLSFTAPTFGINFSKTGYNKMLKLLTKIPDITIITTNNTSGISLNID